MCLTENSTLEWDGSIVQTVVEAPTGAVAVLVNSVAFDTLKTSGRGWPHANTTNNLPQVLGSAWNLTQVDTSTFH
jgi:hypothetical protein